MRENFPLKIQRKKDLNTWTEVPRYMYSSVVISNNVFRFSVCLLTLARGSFLVCLGETFSQIVEMIKPLQTFSTTVLGPAGFSEMSEL